MSPQANWQVCVDVAPWTNIVSHNGVGFAYRLRLGYGLGPWPVTTHPAVITNIYTYVWVSWASARNLF